MLPGHPLQFSWSSPDKAKLYDHKNDPDEFKNLAKDSDYADVAAELSTPLKKGCKAALRPQTE
jgi:hypothetical protein